MLAAARWLVALSLLCAPLLAVAEEPASAGPRPKIALRFGWKAGMSAAVRYERVRTQTGKPTQTLSLRGRLVVERRDNRLAVFFRDWEGGQGDLAAFLRAGEQVATLVDSSGHMAGLEGVASAIEALRKLPPLAGGDAEVTKRVLAMAPAMIQNDAQETWGSLAALWAGNELELGEPYESESEAPVAVVPGEKVRLRLDVVARRQADCPGAAARKCVELFARSEPDREDVSRLVKAIAAQLAGAPAAAAVNALGEAATVSEVTLVAEPDGLVPHRLEVTKTVAINSPGAAEGAAVAQRVDRKTWTFTYPAPAKGK